MRVNFSNNFVVPNNYINKNVRNTDAQPQLQQNSIENNNYKYGYYKDYNIAFRGDTNFSDVLKQVSEQIEQNPEIIEALKTREGYNDTEAIITFLKGREMISKSPETVLKLLDCKYDDSDEYKYELDSIQDILAEYKDDSEILEYVIEKGYDAEDVLNMYYPLKTAPEYIKALEQRKLQNGMPWVCRTTNYKNIADAYVENPDIADYVVNLTDNEGYPRFLHGNEFENVYRACNSDTELAKSLLESKNKYGEYLITDAFSLYRAMQKSNNN